MNQVNLQGIRTMAEAAAGAITHIFLHWSAGHYGQPFEDYHICVDKNGEVYAIHDDLTKRLAHTWHHNTGAVAVSLLCAYNATTEDLGPEPPTAAQIEAMAQTVAVLCRGLGIPCAYNHVRTHAEQADLDGYGPATTCERWDLLFLNNADRTPGGNLIRGKANWYLQNGIGN
jgi:hypothetical protein